MAQWGGRGRKERREKLSFPFFCSALVVFFLLYVLFFLLNFVFLNFFFCFCFCFLFFFFFFFFFSFFFFCFVFFFSFCLDLNPIKDKMEEIGERRGM